MSPMAVVRCVSAGTSDAGSRWECREKACERGSFTERIEQVPAGRRMTGRLRTACGQAVVDGGRTVVQAGRDLSPSWPVVMRATVAYAARVLPRQPPVTGERVPDRLRGSPAPEQQLTTQQPRSAVKLTHPVCSAATPRPRRKQARSGPAGRRKRHLLPSPAGEGARLCPERRATAVRKAVVAVERQSTTSSRAGRRTMTRPGAGSRW